MDKIHFPLTVLSWDVGIKNLAYCLIHFESEDDFQIKKWDKINLIQDDEDILICCGNTKETKKSPEKKCNKKATLFIEHNGNYYGLCKTHSDTEIIDEREINKLFMKYDNDDAADFGGMNDTYITCEHPNKDGTKCGKFAYHLFNNEETPFLCNQHKTFHHNKCLKNLVPKPIKKLNSRKFPIEKLQMTLARKLDELKKTFFKVDHVIIENQPSLKNPKMKAIASTLQNYFMIRGIVDAKLNQSMISKIKFISPSNKMKLDLGSREQLLKTKKKDVYKVTKLLSVKYCLEILEEKEDEENLKFLDSNKKKDDLCDALLQSLYYVRAKKAPKKAPKKATKRKVQKKSLKKHSRKSKKSLAP